MFALCRSKHWGSTPMGSPGNFGPKWPGVCKYYIGLSATCLCRLPQPPASNWPSV